MNPAAAFETEPADPEAMTDDRDHVAPCGMDPEPATEADPDEDE